MAGFLFLSACETPLEVNPRASVAADLLITDASSAAVAMTGMYDALQRTGIFSDALPYQVDLLSDNQIHIGTFTSLREMGDNDVLSTNVEIRSIWDDMYNAIYRTNLIISVLPTVDDPALDPAQFDGEAKFQRALMYYYLVNLFGPVPLVTEPLVTLDDVNKPRASVDEINNQILADLNAAIAQLSSSGNATRASKGAANALLAKMQLNLGNYSAAIAAADAVMADGAGYALEANYDDLFVPGTTSNEAIFQIAYNSVDGNSISFWYWDKPGGRHEIAPDPTLLAAYETGDLRYATSIANVDTTANPDAESVFYINKYRDFATGIDQPYAIRLADIMLVKAEAAARSNDPATAQTIVNTIRARAGLADITLDAGNAVAAVMNERRIELAFEGQRWLDMKRSGEATTFLTAKGRSANDLLMPIPDREIETNTAITEADQNPGY